MNKIPQEFVDKIKEKLWLSGEDLKTIDQEVEKYNHSQQRGVAETELTPTESNLVGKRVRPADSFCLEDKKIKGVMYLKDKGLFLEEDVKQDLARLVKRFEGDVIVIRESSFIDTLKEIFGQSLMPDTNNETFIGGYCDWKEEK